MDLMYHNVTILAFMPFVKDLKVSREQYYTDDRIFTIYQPEFCAPLKERKAEKQESQTAAQFQEESNQMSAERAMSVEKRH